MGDKLGAHRLPLAHPWSGPAIKALRQPPLRFHIRVA
jgi:hypothetical protein